MLPGEKYFLASISLVLLACSGQKNIPKDLLSQQEMVQILIDVHILEAEIKQLRIAKDSSQLLFNTYERQIFEKHNIAKERYLRSYAYYLEDLEEMEEIYAALVDSLSYREKSMEAAVPAEHDEDDRTQSY